MLNYLKLSHFLKHHELSVEFTAGMNLVRGANEEGKSSMLEGLGYNWFGSSALAKPLEDTVYDADVAAGRTSTATPAERKKAVKKLKTESGFTIRGVAYTCFRSTSGAELRIGSEVLVTGQNEVTAKVEELFGLPAGKAMNIIFAEQNAIRGILAAGPTAAAEFIEKLGDFGQADQLVKELAEKVVNGPVAPVKEDIERLGAKVAELESEEMPDIASLTAAVATNTEAYESAVQEHMLASDADKALCQQSDTVATRKGELERGIAAVESSSSHYETELHRLTGVTGKEDEIIKASVELQDQAAAATDWADYLVFLGLPKCPEEFWEGNHASAVEELREQHKTKSAIAGELAVVNSEITQLGNKTEATEPRVNCSECGKPYDNAEEIRVAVEKQRVASEKRVTDLAEKRQERAGILTKLRETEEYLDQLGGLIDLEQQNMAQAASILDKVTILDTQIPRRVVWEAAVLDEVAVPSQASVEEVAKDLADVETAKSQLEVLVEPDTSGLTALREELLSLPPVPTTKELEDAALESLSLAALAKTAKEKLQTSETALSSATTQVAVHGSNLEGSKKDLADAEQRLSDISANNALIKRVRAARVQVTERLWSHVLNTTSAFFGHFRGRQSDVSRGPKGFMVDGSNSRPSGSTLDILGLSIRIAVARIFSECGVLILDEPSAGCDAERTALMTSGLLSTGFDQLIMVTHKDADESAGGNLIQL